MTVTAHNAPTYAPQMLNYGVASRRQAIKNHRLADRYFLLLCLTLLGYALGGRGFAYWGVNPIFVGEIMLLYGVVVMLKTGVLSRVLAIREFIPLMLFMLWGACRTIPFIDRYQKDAIRDAVIWGYGTYAFVFAALLISDPTRIQRLIIYYRKFVILFLTLAPIVIIICGYFDTMVPLLPVSGVPVIQVKGGDICVHLAGAFAYIVTLGHGLNPWIISIFLPFNLALNVQGRGGMLSFVSAVFVTALVRPLHPRALRIFFVLAVGLFFFWASDFRMQRGPREISFRMLITNFQSLTGEVEDTDLMGTREWRKNWWRDIVNYTFYGQYFWTGKGYGINLANDDGYQVEESEALRSPHNGHMTMLARGGVPGFAIWVLVQLTWATTIVKSYFWARRRKHVNWAGLFLFLGCYWMAMQVNASFDVAIEGPMGGIWLWCVYGVGIASAYVYRRCPDLLTPVHATPTFR